MVVIISMIVLTPIATSASLVRILSTVSRLLSISFKISAVFFFVLPAPNLKYFYITKAVQNMNDFLR